MAIVSGVNIPDNKRVETALTSIYGIGPFQAKDILEKSGVFDNPRVNDLGDDQLNKIREIIDSDKLVEGDLRREVNQNIRRLIDLVAIEVVGIVELYLSEVRELKLMLELRGDGEWLFPGSIVRLDSKS